MAPTDLEPPPRWMAPKKGAPPPEPEPEPEPEAPPEPEEGEGIFYFPDNSKYEGLWLMKDGVKMRHGKGMFVEGVPEGSAPQSYEGEWREDAMHGHGTYTFPDGSSYEGAFQAGQMHGAGCYLDKQGVSWNGKFYNGMGPGLPTNATFLAA